jgi:hypothetical protein
LGFLAFYILPFVHLLDHIEIIFNINYGEIKVGDVFIIEADDINWQVQNKPKQEDL